MKPDAFLKLADNLIYKNSDSANIRTAISRFYYGTYHLSLLLINTVDIQLPRTTEIKETEKAGRGDHIKLQECFRNSKNDNLKQIGNKLSNLHGDRKKADYELSNTDIENKKNVEFIQSRTQQLADEINELIVDVSTHASIKSNINIFIDSIKKQ